LHVLERRILAEAGNEEVQEDVSHEK
jgi:hypothetical protein